MTTQGFVEIASTAHETTMMALWMSSGGALDPLGTDDAETARGRRSGDGTDDGGLRAGLLTLSTNPFGCAENGLQASNVTKGYGCIPPSADDGLQAGTASLSCTGLF